jgi:imidazolonepropionase
MTPPHSSLLLRGVGTLVTCDPSQGEGPLGLVRDAAILCQGERIVYAGPQGGLPRPDGPEPMTLDLDGHMVLPGLVDCHTHLMFAGDRLDDFEARLGGDSYSAIASRGGGILSTVRATRAASDELLVDLTEGRAERLAAHGVTTVEVKSGYGLDARQELRLLELVRKADRRCIAELVPTFLGAHALPVEARRSDEARQAYVDSVVEEMLPAVAERDLARFCDVFVERGAFTLDEGRRVLEAAAALGLKLKVHADQLTATGAAGLAAELGAVSAEHLEQASDADLKKMADAGTVAVLLPGAALFLQDTPPQARRFREAGVKMAVATDFNPGSSPSAHLPLMAQLAVLQGGLTVNEAILAITAYAADALALGEDRGRIRTGMRADLALYRLRDPRELLYEIGANHCTGIVKSGRYHRVDSARTARIRPGLGVA